MKKNNDDWEEFLKQRDKEKPKEEAEIKELLNHSSDDDKQNKIKYTDSSKLYSQSTSTDPVKTKTNNIDLSIEDTDKEITDEELLNTNMTVEEAKMLYDEASDKYDKAFELWETDPDNEEYETKLDLSEREYNIAQRRYCLLFDKSLNEQKANIKNILLSPQDKQMNQRPSIMSDEDRRKQKKFTFGGILFTAILLIAFFNIAFMSSRGKAGVGIAIFIGVIILFVVLNIIIAYLSVKPKDKEKPSVSTHHTISDEHQDVDPDFVEDYSANKHKPQKDNLNHSSSNRRKSLMLFVILGLCIFALIIGSSLKNLPLVLTGFIGFIGTIILASIISTFISNKARKNSTSNVNINFDPFSSSADNLVFNPATSQNVLGTVRVCKESKNSKGETCYIMIIEANNTYYLTTTEISHEINSSVTITIDPEHNGRKCKIDE